MKPKQYSPTKSSVAKIERLGAGAETVVMRSPVQFKSTAFFPGACYVHLRKHS